MPMSYPDMLLLSLYRLLLILSTYLTPNAAFAALIVRIGACRFGQAQEVDLAHDRTCRNDTYSLPFI